MWHGLHNLERRETFLRGAGLVFAEEVLRIDVPNDGVVDLNKMFFTANCLRALIIQRVVHLRRAAIQTRLRDPEGFLVSLSNVGKG